MAVIQFTVVTQIKIEILYFYLFIFFAVIHSALLDLPPLLYLH